MTEQTYSFPATVEGSVASLPAGPWSGEPDKVVWVDDATSLDCMLHRNSRGTWCGYVGVPEYHPWHGVDYESIDAASGRELTYAAGCAPREPYMPEGFGLCHVAAPGRPAHVWWVGFAFDHVILDVAPRDQLLCAGLYGPPFPDAAYRDVAYARAAVQLLAAHAAAATRPDACR
jgi:hypothetical protein